MAIQIPFEQEIQATPLSAPSVAPVRSVGMEEIARGTANIANQVTRESQELQRKRDASRVFEMEVERDAAFARVRHELLQSRKGTSAYGIVGDVESWWEQNASKFEQNLENETQRLLFRQSTERQRLAAITSFSEYERREMDAGLKAAGEAAINVLAETGAANFDNPDALAMIRQDLVDRANALTVLRGESKDGPVGEAARLAALTKLNTMVLDNLIATGEVEKAKDYFERVKEDGSLAPSTWATFQHKIETAGSLASAQKITDDVMSRGLSEQEALAAVRKEAKPGVERQRAEELVKVRYAELRAAEEQAKKEIVDDARAKFAQGGLAALTDEDVTNLLTYAPEEYRRLQKEQWTPQDAVATDYAKMDELRTMFLEKPGEFARLDIEQYRMDFHTTDWATVKSWHDAAVKGVTAPTATIEQILREIPWSPKEKKDGLQGAFERAVREQIDAEKQSTGKTPSNDRVRQIVDRQLMEVRLPRNYWFDRRARLFELDPEERARMVIEVDEIPARDRQQIEDALRKAGFEVTPENIVSLFRSVNGL